MVYINSEQYQMLKTIKKSDTLSSEALSVEQKEIINFLLEHKFIREVSSEFITDSFIDEWEYTTRRVVCYKITQEGLVEMANYNTALNKWWITLAISIIALIVSIFK